MSTRLQNAGKTYYEMFAGGASVADVVAKYGKGAQSIRTSALSYAVKHKLATSVIPLGKPGRVAVEVTDELLELVRNSPDATVDELVETSALPRATVQRAREQLGLVAHRASAAATGQVLYTAASAVGSDLDWSAVAKAHGLASGRIAALRANRYATENSLPVFDVPEKSARLPRDLESVRSVFETSTVEDAMAHFNVGRSTILAARTKLGLENPRGRRGPMAISDLGKEIYELRVSGMSWVAATEKACEGRSEGISPAQARRRVALYMEANGLTTKVD